MKKILTSKAAAVAIIWLLLMGASMRPSEACRVLINDHRAARADGEEEPGLIVLQTLKKGPTPCTGNCGSYTPGSSTTAGTTSNKAFAGRLAVSVPPRDYTDRVPGSGNTADRI
ncbi:uncharacterized protein J3R85_017494 [Psidium guajava]|nr:uncharacterized protein J3R85_017494 [Psidium guajava]